MIERQELYGIKHYDYGEAYYGSDNGMRFRVSRVPLENVIFKSEEERKAQDPHLLAEVWFEDKSYDSVSKDSVTVKEFEYSEDGYIEMISWLNDREG